MKKLLAFMAMGLIAWYGITTQPVHAASVFGDGGQFTSQADFLQTSFAATHAAPNSYLIHDWTEVSHTFSSEAALQQITNDLQQELHVQKAKVFKRTNKGEHFYELSGIWHDATQVSLTLSSFQFSSQSAMTLLIIHVANDSGKLTRFRSELSTVRDAVTKLRLTPQISACIEGSISARMSGDYAKRLVDQSFKAVSAHRIGGITTPLVTSISGYSSRESQFIQSNGHHMNLQVAVHFDQYHHRTNVLVGTPIITKTY
jgi:hypothetical protein